MLLICHIVWWIIIWNIIQSYSLYTSIIINYIIIIIIKNGDFLTRNYEIKSFNSIEEAESLLKESRNRIDEIDNELFDLISQRTFIAKDIVLAKEYIGMPIYDKSREDAIHEKVREISEKKGLDVDIIDQIVNMLTILSKDEQKKILRRNVDGQY